MGTTRTELVWDLPEYIMGAVLRTNPVVNAHYNFLVGGVPPRVLILIAA